jgi:4-hydroxybenzoate polyprenyltransferase
MGTVIHPLPLSPWLNSFSCLFFLSLALAKRQVEKIAAKADGRTIAGRGYVVDDWPVTLGFGIASACASIVVMLLFITEQGGSAGYSSPERLFVVPVVLTLWLMRIWLLSHRGTFDEDPVIFALSDRVSLVLGATVVAAGVLAG